MLVPPIAPVVRFFLSTTGIVSTVLAKVAQVLGFWRTDKGGVEDIFPDSERQMPPVSDTQAPVDSDELRSSAKQSGHKLNVENDTNLEVEVQKMPPSARQSYKGDRTPGDGERNHRPRGVEEPRQDQKGSSQHNHVPRQRRT